MTPAPGRVSTQAATRVLGTFQLTAPRDLADPTPVMLPAIICVELIGIPKKLAQRMTSDAVASAANPWMGSIFVIENPMVWMMRKPPDAVPRPIVRAQAKITHRGISGWCRSPEANRPRVMIPILFCASLSP